MVGSVGRRGDARPRLDRGRLPRPRRPARDRRPDPRRHRQGRATSSRPSSGSPSSSPSAASSTSSASWATSASGWPGALGGLSAAVAGVVLVVAYVLLHYLFVSQTAHLLALFGVFLDVGVKLGVPVAIARLPAALRHQLLLGQHAAGLEREPALRGERLPLAGRALPAGRAHHRLQPRAVPRRRDPLARAGDPMRLAPARQGDDRPSRGPSLDGTTNRLRSDPRFARVGT